MKRQEAIAELKRMASTIEWDYPLDAQIAIEKAVEALRGPEPDPDTGLVPCGCGGKARLLRKPIGNWVDHKIACDSCTIETAWVAGKDSANMAKIEWNTAMGYTAPSRPDAGEMAPNGDEGAES